MKADKNKLKGSYSEHTRKFLDDIANVMEEEGYTCSDVAKRTGMSVRTVRNTLNDVTRNFSLRTMVKLANAVGCKLILSFEDNN